MKYLLLSIVMCGFVFAAHAQYTFKAQIIQEENTPLAGATVTWKEQHKSFAADSSGSVIINDIPAGTQTFEISHVGSQPKTVSYTFPLLNNAVINIIMEDEEMEQEEVIVSVTRTSRTIGNIPIRVETISGEELEEKANMKPGDIRMLLYESTGIQTQQTSATSYNSGIRIQGLDGRYTQILRDGFPLYSGFSSGLSLMQIAPLDLKQAEVIKGSSSTLYGGGAIAGLVNLVSKVPEEKTELSLLANGTTAKGLDLSAFYSQKYKHLGLTVFGSRNTNSAFDPANIGLTAIPEFKRYTINPRLFIYGKNTTANVGFSYITEDRTGGSMEYIKQNTQGYFEKNNTDRFTAQAAITHRVNEHSTINFKNSYTRFNRFIEVPSYKFEGLQQSTFSELTYNIQKTKAQWIAGLNLLSDGFEEQQHSNDEKRDYKYHTYGIFVQNTWSLLNFLTLESGIRGDYVKQYGFELLPRISALIKVSPAFTTRIGGGLGYKTPTVFNEDAERLQFRHILPVNEASAFNERSLGGNLDFNYKAKLGKAGFSVNHLFFYTRLNNPYVLTATQNGSFVFVNANGHIDTKGMETNIKLTYADLKLFVGYTYVDVNNHFNNIKSTFPLTARHRLNNVLMYEKDEKLKVGLEAYYFSPQLLNDGSTGRSYWTMGFMVEKMFKHVSLYINLENFTDVRQTKFGSIYTGPITDPVFRDIYAPIEGFVANGGVKIKL